MKILHIISSTGMYGAESVILNLCQRLNEERHQNLVGVLFSKTKPYLELHQTCRQLGIESHLIPCKGQLDWRAIAHVRELAFSAAAHIVHAHGYKADVFVHLALHRTQLPYVATCHNWLDNDRKSRLYGYVDRWVLRKYTNIAAVSNEVQLKLCRCGVDPCKIELIRSGIDTQQFRPKQDSCQSETAQGSDLSIGFVGRLSWEKGPDIFVQAANQVLRHRKGVKFLLAGDGPDSPVLKSSIGKLNIAENIALLGYLKDPASFYKGLDIMVSTSRREGFPIAILEGMANGLPVIATSVGDVPMVIEDGRTGLLILPENPELVANAILDLLEDPVKRTRLGAAARERVKEGFSSDRMARDYLRFYEKAIGNDPKSKRRTNK